MLEMTTMSKTLLGTRAETHATLLIQNNKFIYDDKRVCKKKLKKTSRTERIRYKNIGNVHKVYLNLHGCNLRRRLYLYIKMNRWNMIIILKVQHVLLFQFHFWWKRQLITVGYIWTNRTLIGFHGTSGVCNANTFNYNFNSYTPFVKTTKPMSPIID